MRRKRRPAHAGSDPFEHFNRGARSASARAWTAPSFVPPAIGYKTRPAQSPVRTGVRNALNNVDEPVTFLNDVLQARISARASVTLLRFVVNSTAGIGGMIDIVGDRPAYRSTIRTSASVTLLPVRRGTRPSYLSIPVLGPSDVALTADGHIVDSFTGILNIHDLPRSSRSPRLALVVVDGLDTRAEFDGDIATLHRTPPPTSTARPSGPFYQAEPARPGHRYRRRRDPAICPTSTLHRQRRPTTGRYAKNPNGRHFLEPAMTVLAPSPAA